MGNSSLSRQPVFPAKAGSQKFLERTAAWPSSGSPPARGKRGREGVLLVLRQAQDEEEWEILKRPTFLMLSLSKHGQRKPIPTSRVPREGGEPEVSRTDRGLALIWIPAFAGNAGERGGLLVLRQAQDEEECWVRALLFLIRALNREPASSPASPRGRV